MRRDHERKHVTVNVQQLTARTQVDPLRCVHFTMTSVTYDGHDYHIHEDTAERSFTVVNGHDHEVIGTAHISPCGEYWLVQIEDDDAAPFGCGWAVHVNSATAEDVAQSIIAAVTF